MLYAISARVHTTTTDETGRVWTCTFELPTFYLDENVQGITDEDHAERIVSSMLRRLGHDMFDVYACATNRPIFEADLEDHAWQQGGASFPSRKGVDDDKFGAL